MQSYLDFIDQSYGFPTKSFKVIDDELFFHGINMMELIETYKTPLRFTYLPVISQKIKEARGYFNKAIKKYNYEGSYEYCYCTKSSHFKHIMIEVLKNHVHLETSSAFDLPIIQSLYKSGDLSKDKLIICNGFKDLEYKQNIVDLIHDGFKKITPILDNKDELNYYQNEIDGKFKIGIRMATEEPPDSDFYTSRLGMKHDDIIDFYKKKVKPFKNIDFSILHFFVHTGIQDKPFFWKELNKFVQLYCDLKKLNPSLNKLDIGGGFPFANSLYFDFEYEYIADLIIKTIQKVCKDNETPVPDILTEFGSFTVAESSCTLFKVLSKKSQNDRENWMMIDGSLISMIPDIWALDRKFILLPINNWEQEYELTYIGGMTCDSDDYYAQVAHKENLYLPKTRKQQYLGFFHTGAYQEMLSGVGGLHHCLIPDPKHVLLTLDKDGSKRFRVLHEEQNSKQVLKILGYK